MANLKEDSKKKTSICIRLLPAQIHKLDDTAEKMQLNRSDVVRELINGMKIDGDSKPAE